jgi:hypothetical protein
VEVVEMKLIAEVIGVGGQHCEDRNSGEPTSDASFL